MFWTHISLGTLVDLQLDAQNSYLFAYNTFIFCSTCTANALPIKLWKGWETSK